jgi:hypothetical protein
MTAGNGPAPFGFGKVTFNGNTRRTLDSFAALVRKALLKLTDPGSGGVKLHEFFRHRVTR